MIRGILKDGQVHFMEPIPEHWEDGREVVVAAGELTPTDQEIDRWAAECDRLAAAIDAEAAGECGHAFAEMEAQEKLMLRIQEKILSRRKVRVP